MSPKQALKEYEAPFKDKAIYCGAYELIELLVKNGVEKSKAIVVLDTIVNHQKVILREIRFPDIKFRQIHSRKTKGKPDVHIQIPREDYKVLKGFLRRIGQCRLFTVTANRDGLSCKIGVFNKFTGKNSK